MAKHEYFITLKDHKDHEEDHRTKIYRLRNPTKSQLGKIRKQILQKINKTLRFELNMNQWQNSSEVIDWFKNTQQISLYTFSL